MVEETPGGRPSRRRQPSKRYTVDAFEGLDLDDSGPERETPLAVDDDEDDDGDFEVGKEATPDAEDDMDLDDAEQEVWDRSSVAWDRSSVAGEPDLADEETLDVKVRKVRGRKAVPGKPLNTKRMAKDTRGLLDRVTRNAKGARRLYLFGPDPGDQEPALKARFKWGEEATLPSRKATLGGFGGFNPGFYRTEAMRKKEAVEDWMWYDEEGGKEKFQSLQQCNTISEVEARNFMPTPAVDRRSFVMGPFKGQQLFSLEPGRSMKLQDAWQPDEANPEEASMPQKNGFMLNLGDRVHCAEWAPNQPGNRQFLAVSTMPLKGRRPDSERFKEPTAPAFTPQQPYKSSIQIWEFAVGPDNYIDTDQPPQLRQVICTEWGDVRSLKWCPVPHKERPIEGGKHHLGLLLGLWGDGSVRVLDVSVPDTSSSPPEYLYLTHAAFTSRPPNTVCTSITWLSSTGIAAGCANGCVAIWNLPSSLPAASPTPPSNPRPALYSAVATTYILSITICYPSRPHLLLTTSMSGHIHLTDLTASSSLGAFSPATTIPSPRSRVGKPVLVWHDWSQMALSVDENYTMLGYAARQFFATLGLTRFRSPVAALAVSPVHPFVIAATGGGDCVGNNPLRRAMDAKASIWNATWFAHEWRPGVAGPVADLKEGGEQDRKEQDGGGGAEAVVEEAAAGLGKTALARKSANQLYAEQNGERSPGLSRIVEGFAAERIKLFHSEDALQNKDQGIVYSTIYEPETAVTAVAWNPNIHVGGWIAAGMADGLLRVEDVAV